jgi:four helix bundle protein
MTDDNRGLDHLEIWQVALNFSVTVLRNIIPLLPIEEKWALASQLRRSAQSIPANIAEGYGRYYFTENVRFCYIARGSLEETYSHLVLANRLGYVPEPQLHSCISEIIRLRKLLNGYIAFLKRSKRGENEPGAQSVVREARMSYDWNDPITEDYTGGGEPLFDLTNNESTNTENTPEHEGKQD